jgi:hypothetical protein
LLQGTIFFLKQFKKFGERSQKQRIGSLVQLKRTTTAVELGPATTTRQ